jgi:DNA-binding beta-propeller fold protein YncE
MKRFFLLYIGLILPLIVPAAIAGTGYHVVARIPLPGNDGWDYVTADAASRRLYVTHGMQVQVLDLDTQTLVGTVGPTFGAHGVALAPALGRGFISNGKASTLTVFDLKTLAVIATLPSTGKKPDAVLYDSFSKRVFACNGESENATVFDAATGRVLGTVALGGSPEFAVSDGTGQIFINLEDRNEVVRCDARSLQVTARWPLGPGESPTALAFDPVGRRLLAGCRNRHLVVLNAGTGAIEDVLPIGGGVDAAVVDPVRGLAFAANGDGTLTMMQRGNTGHYAVIDTVQTQVAARTLARDEQTGRIYLPCARPDSRPSRLRAGQLCGAGGVRHLAPLHRPAGKAQSARLTARIGYLVTVSPRAPRLPGVSGARSNANSLMRALHRPLSAICTVLGMSASALATSRKTTREPSLGARR